MGLIVLLLVGGALVGYGLWIISRKHKLYKCSDKRA